MILQAPDNRDLELWHCIGMFRARTVFLLTILLCSLASATEILPLDSDDYTLSVTHEVKHPKVNFPDQ
jgi:hypothetical protein